MMLPCLLLAVVALVGGDTLSSSKYFWLLLIGICVVPHLFMMWKGKGKCCDDEESDTKQAKGNNADTDHKHTGGCH